MIKVLHIIIDQKFIDGAISLFETDSRTINSYYIIGKAKEKTEFVKYKNIQYIDLKDIKKLCLNYQVIYLHSLAAVPISLIEKIPLNIKIIWLAWGYDLYENNYRYIIPTQLYMKFTKKYLKEIKSSLKNKLVKIKRDLVTKLHLKKALSRIDYFSGVFPYEYNEICRKHKYFKAIPLDFYYGSINFFIPEEASNTKYIKRNSIIIGNSGNPTNNHIDILILLKDIQMPNDLEIVLPLSYGGEIEYNSKVVELANKISYNRVNAMNKFIPLADYINIISSCKVAIYGHYRQQASDNIFMQLIYGAKVYMSEKSLAFNYLKKMGLKIYSIESEIHNMWDEISYEDVMHNRHLLSKHYSSIKLIERINVINNILINDIN